MYIHYWDVTDHVNSWSSTVDKVYFRNWFVASAIVISSVGIGSGSKATDPSSVRTLKLLLSVAESSFRDKGIQRTFLLLNHKDRPMSVALPNLWCCHNKVDAKLSHMFERSLLIQNSSLMLNHLGIVWSMREHHTRHWLGITQRCRQLGE